MQQPEEESSFKFGVIQAADFEGRMCDVRWLQSINNTSQTTTTATNDQEIERDISVYDIADHPDFSFRPGDTVVRLSTILDDNMRNDKEELENKRLGSVGQVCILIDRAFN